MNRNSFDCEHKQESRKESKKIVIERFENCIMRTFRVKKEEIQDI